MATSAEEHRLRRAAWRRQGVCCHCGCRPIMPGSVSSCRERLDANRERLRLRNGHKGTKRGRPALPRGES